MAWFDETLGNWGTTVLTGVAIAVVAPVLLPVTALVLRAAVKEMIKGGLCVMDTLQETVVEAGEQLSDLIAEAKAEYARARTNDLSNGPR